MLTRTSTLSEGITKVGPDGLTNGKDNKNTQKAQNILRPPWTREGLSTWP